MNHKLSNLNLGSLTASERQDLEHYEAIIQNGLKTFWEVGHALSEIRDKRLYLERYSTFKEYCDKKWGFSDRRARQLISSAEVVDDVKKAIKNGVGKSGTIVPLSDNSKSGNMFPLSNERQAEALITTPPNQRASVLTAATKTAPNGTLTASHIKQVAQTAHDNPKAKSPGAIVKAHLEHKSASNSAQDALWRQEQRISEALRTIQAQKLWRATSESFDDYVEGLVERIRSEL